MRTFLAIELPKEMQDLLSESAAQFSGQIPEGCVRWVRPEGRHLTLKFLGEASPGKLEAVSRMLQRVIPLHAAFVMRLQGLGCFPGIARPRVLWVGVAEETGVLHNLQTELEGEFAQLGFQRERRSFHPHLTLGRIRRGVRKDELRALSTAMRNTELGSLGEVKVSAVSLMRSVLKPSGAEYSCLSSFALRGVE